MWLCATLCQWPEDMSGSSSQLTGLVSFLHSGTLMLGVSLSLLTHIASIQHFQVVCQSSPHHNHVRNTSLCYFIVMVTEDTERDLCYSTSKRQDPPSILLLIQCILKNVTSQDFLVFKSIGCRVQCVSGWISTLSLNPQILSLAGQFQCSYV